MDLTVRRSDSGWLVVVHRHRHRLIAVASFVAGAVVTWMLSATGTDGDFYRSLLYPWMYAAVLFGGVILGVTVSVRSAVAALVPFTVPQLLLAIWQGQHEAALWVVGFVASAALLVFAIGSIAIGVCIRLMFRR
jgi:hypothetical protein